MNENQDINKDINKKLERLITYEEAGVSINKAEELVRRLKKKLPDIGDFSGLFPLEIKRYKSPLLVASTDGVGTKLLIAQEMKQHKTIGIDLVAMVVNDLCCCGAKPLFFLDYFATGKLKLTEAEDILIGIIEGCRRAGCLLLGGETAEMPGMYPKGKYELAGFGVGIVDEYKIINGSSIKPGDIFIGLCSDGLHSNGYSLARRVLLDKAKMSFKLIPPELNESLGEALLKPTRIYSPLIQEIVEKIPIKGIAHITGGGIPGNLSRILPKNVDAHIRGDDIVAWKTSGIFQLIRETGPVSLEEMFNTFNMGFGMVIAIEPEKRKHIEKILRQKNQDFHIIGKAFPGKGIVKIDFNGHGE